MTADRRMTEGASRELRATMADHAAGALARAEARGQVRRPGARDGFGGGYARWLPARRASMVLQADRRAPAGQVKHFVSVVLACRQWFLAVQWGRVVTTAPMDKTRSRNVHEVGP